jgi:anti-sigma-K factor RskA
MTTDPDFTLEHDYVEPLLAEHALGTADVVHRARVDAHIALCAACRTTFAELTDAVAGLERAVHAPSLEPRAHARESLVAAARTTPQLAAPAAAGAPAAIANGRAARPQSRRWRQWILVAAPTLAGAALLGATWNQAGRIDTLEQRVTDARGDQVPVLKGASINDLDIGGPFGNTRAQVVLKRDAGIITFRTVPAPPQDMVWQVWAVDGDERLHSLGTIDDERELAIVAIDGVDPEDVERIIVTTEPRDGSDATTTATPDETDAIAEATI